jgi:hypothetical protein
MQRELSKKWVRSQPQGDRLWPLSPVRPVRESIRSVTCPGVSASNAGAASASLNSNGLEEAEKTPEVPD